MKQKEIYNIVVLFLVCTLLIAGLTKWFGDKPAQTNLAANLLVGENGEELKLNAPLSPEALKNDTQPILNMKNPKAIVTTNKGVFELELFADQMPGTVANFVKLAEAGFYDGTKFHRVIESFMIQGGDPNSKGTDASVYGQGGPGYTIQDEFVAAPNLSNKRGSIAMANTGQPNSGGSQFFINTADNVGLDFNVPDPNDSKHPVFGHIISGMDIINTISATETGAGDVPVDPIVIKSVKIMSAEATALPVTN